MKIIFTQVNPRYYAVYNENDGKYIQPLATIQWDDLDRRWEFFPKEHDYIFLKKEEFNTINTFFQALEDLDSIEEENVHE